MDNKITENQLQNATENNELLITITQVASLVTAAILLLSFFKI